MADLRTDVEREEHSGQPLEKRYWGPYLGFVRDTADPEERGQVRFYCPEVMGDRDHPDNWTPWALPCLGMAGGHNTGQFAVPPAPADSQQGGSPSSALRQWACWLQFRHGDPRFPIYLGGFYLKDSDLPDFAPKLASAASVRSEPSIGFPAGAATLRVKPINVANDGSATIGDATTATEPPPAADPLYPHNRLYRSPSGHVQEMDDTPGDERVRTYHRSGTSWEMTADGSLVTRVIGKNFAYVSEDDIRNIVGGAIHIFNGDYAFQARRQVENVIDGQKRTIVGSDEQYWNNAGFVRTVSGLFAVDAQAVRVTSTEGIELTAAGGLAIGAGERLDAVAMQAQLIGALTLGLGCPAGVSLHGALGLPSAVEPILGGTTLIAALTAIAVAYNTGLAPYLALNPPIPVPPNEAFIFTLIGTALAGLAGAAASAATIHRVSKI